jgi:hypothetical protein
MDPRAKTDNPDRTPVARDLFTYCTKEKIDTWHVVMNHNNNGIVDRVKCKACGSEHRYRSTKMAAAAKKTPVGTTLIKRSNGMTMKVDGPSTRKMSAAKAAESAADSDKVWLNGLKQWGDREVPAFDPTVPLTIGQVVNHPVFGKGVVQGRRENRVDVLFKDGVKTLPSPRV